MVSYFTPFLNCATGSLLARPDSATTHENRKVFIDLLKNDSATSGKVKLQKFGGASSKTGGGVAKVGDVIAQKKTPFGLLKLKLAPDGSVVFEPNKALAALKAGQVFKTSFTYTIADADGHLSSAVVKLNIKGLNDGPTVLSGQGSAPTPVFELADASAQDIWLTGSFRVSDLDKGDILTAKVVGGPVLAYSGGAVPGGSDIHALTDTSVLKFTSTASNGGARTIGWTYDPGPANLDFLAAGETLTVSFQVRITDGHAKAPTQTLTFTIVGTNDAATISGHHAGTVYEDGDLYAVDVDAETLAYVQAFGHAPTTVGGDLDIADKDRGEAVFRKPAADALHGEYGDFAFNETTGAWTYTLDEGRADKLAEGQKVTETLTVTSKDGTAHETIVVTIYGNNDAATFTGDDAGMVTEDFDTDGNPANGVATTASGDLHATDVDSAPDFVVGTVAGQYGSLTIGADGKWTYTLDNGNPVVDALNPGSTPLKDTIVVTTVDGTTHEIAITINGANDAPHAQDDPTAVDDALATPEDQAIVVDALANDTDVDGDALVITSATAADPSTGTASVVVQGGKTVIVFTPAENYHGPAVVNYTISDGHGGTDQAVVKIEVTPANDAPVAADDAVATLEDQAIVVDALANDTDVDGDALVITSATAADPSTGTASVVVQGGKTVIVFTPAENYHGPAVVNYTISDGHGGTDQAVVKIEVTPANDAPVAADDAVATPEDQAIVVDALANDTDVDGDALVITSATAADPSTGTASVVVQGGKTVIVFTPAENYHGPAVVNYTISDGHGGTDQAVVKIEVTPANDRSGRRETTAAGQRRDHDLRGPRDHR